MNSETPTTSNSNSIYQAPSSSSLQEGAMVSCVGCGADIHQTASICPQCGASQRTKRYKNKVAAALFAFFLGGFGAHRFYLGQWWGIFYLLLFWTWIPGLIALVEFVVFLATSQKRWDDKYNEGKPSVGKESGGAAIVLVIILGGFFFVAILGILAAIAIPAYQDYTARAKVAGAVFEVTEAKSEFESFYAKNNVFPTANIMVGLEEPLYTADGHAVSISEQGIQLIFASDIHSIDGQTILFRPSVDNQVFLWDCRGGSLMPRYRPHQCR